MMVDFMRKRKLKQMKNECPRYAKGRMTSIDRKAVFIILPPPTSTRRAPTPQRMHRIIEKKMRQESRIRGHTENFARHTYFSPTRLMQTLLINHPSYSSHHFKN
jgi:hypothetical protein